MIHVLYDEIMRQFFLRYPAHPFLQELLTAIALARFELTPDTMSDVEMVAGKLMVLSGGTIKCIVDPTEEQETLCGHA